ncbi:MAG: glycogen debranching protein GlgX [Vicinamibacterales bacterium]
MRVWPGRPYPLGATWDGRGVNVALFSEHATAVDLCLFDDPRALSETHRIRLREQTDLVWHGYLPDARPGQLYGYRVHGPYDPVHGHRFNPNKVVVDPYAKAIARPTQWSDEMFGYRIGDPSADLSYDPRDNAAHAPLAAVVDPAFNWGDDRRPNRPWQDTVIYELHVKGFTRLHPALPEQVRGTYSALTFEPVLTHLERLGVTAVELMPVHHHVHDRHLVERGLSNYWGYNTLCFLAPHLGYSSSPHPDQVVREFKTMVRTLHAAGIEVILDVVYNHTAEGNHFGPTLSLRGIDNGVYYRLASENRRYYVDFTGTGNTLNVRHPRVLQLIMDSLRYWVLEMHVDGFRFDLASTLARELWEVDRLSAFFDIVHQDPVLSQVKLIAEPWDLGDGGYQVGNFPVLWTEWNGRYRDTVRRFWAGDGQALADLATRVAGSSDLYERTGRRPYASINFVTCHDGFTLRDLVTYNQKHNDGNGDENRDGENHNLSWNCGVEGDTDDPGILRLRDRQVRNFLATLLLSQGVPMIAAGDEIGRTQRGNNNAYCQDNEVSWQSWDLTPEQQDLQQFVQGLLSLRRAHPALRRRRFLRGLKVEGADVKDVVWLAPDGHELSEHQWHDTHARCLGMRLEGHAIAETDDRGRSVVDDSLLLLLNATDRGVRFTLSALVPSPRWTCVVDTGLPTRVGKVFRGGVPYVMQPRSLALFLLPRAKSAGAATDPAGTVSADGSL